MNKIKSLFIGMFPMFAMGISGYGIYYLISSGLNLIWLGAVLTTMPIMLFISRVMMFKNVARTTPHFPLLTLIAIIGLALSMYGYTASIFSPLGTAESNVFNNVSIGLALVGFIFFILYNYWYSSLSREVNQVLRIGKQLPRFEALDIQGERINSTIFDGTPTIYFFSEVTGAPYVWHKLKKSLLNIKNYHL